MMEVCVISARILWLYCETALGPWAGADIAAPGGRSPQGGSMTTTTAAAAKHQHEAWRNTARESMRSDRQRVAELQAQGLTLEQAWLQVISQEGGRDA